LLTQIYEVSTPGEARSISVIGVDHVGILVGNGGFPRELSVERAAEVAAEVLPPSRVSALFMTADLSAILKGAGELHPSVAHLGAAPELLSPGDVAVLKSKLPGALIMRSVPVVDEGSIWTAIGHSIARLARLGCPTNGRSAAVS
jgi:phosphoribosylanthranilate isomerase